MAIGLEISPWWIIPNFVLVIFLFYIDLLGATWVLERRTPIYRIINTFLISNCAVTQSETIIIVFWLGSSKLIHRALNVGNSPNYSRCLKYWSSYRAYSPEIITTKETLRRRFQSQFNTARHKDNFTCCKRYRKLWVDLVLWSSIYRQCLWNVDSFFFPLSRTNILMINYIRQIISRIDL